MIDTNVVSFLMQGGAKAEAYMPHVEGHALSVAFITVGEMYYGAEKANWGERKRAKLEAHLHNFTVISFDRLIARHYGKIRAERRKRGRIIAPNDAWIAACAVRHNVPLVTDDRGFQDIPQLEIITEQPR
ncbi:MAG: type II toxin-antitoxin system VapC family toxin [Gammaproteobacteria bacterium]|nr:type II toxin-antitoxin system VapC family toxin [Gammaproteobacteria bacterium]